MTTPYDGPNLTPIRTITKAGGVWPADADWLGDFSTAEPDAECWSTTGIRRGSGHPLKNIAVYFAAVNSSGVQVAATATVRGIIINPADLYGLKPGLPGIRHPATAELTSYDLKDPLIITCGKHQKMCVRVTAISSVSAVEIRISVQEIQ